MRLKICHLYYDVLPLESLLQDSETAVGLHSPDDATIYIQPDVPPTEQVRTLVHELIHALYHAHNIPKVKRTEEQTCLILETPLTLLLLENPKLLTAILEAKQGKPLVRASRRVVRHRQR